MVTERDNHVRERLDRLKLVNFHLISVMIPVQEHQNLILAVGVQTQDRNLWNIQTTQVQCQHVSLSWRGEDKFLREAFSKKEKVCEISQRGRGPFCIPSE